MPQEGKPFLSDNIHLANFAEGKGDFVTVKELKNKIADPSLGGEGKFVLKEYNKDPVSDLFAQKNLTLEKMASLLKRRQEFTRAYYKELPELVVESQFLIAEGENGQPTIYEFQEKLNNFHETSSEGIDNIVKSLDHEQKEVLIKELRYFVERTNDFIEQKNLPEGFEEYESFFPDLGEQNLVVTADGHLRVIDTNMYHNLWEQDGTFESSEQLLFGLRMMTRELVLSIKKSQKD